MKYCVSFVAHEKIGKSIQHHDLRTMKQLNNVNKDEFYNDGNVLVRPFVNDKCVYKCIAQILRTLEKFLNNFER